MNLENDYELQLQKAINSIEAADLNKRFECQVRWDHIAKPLRSLGKLEDMVIQLCGIKKSLSPTIAKKAVLIFCADNGIVEEGITQSGQEVTTIVATNFTKGTATINAFARVCNADVIPIDIGMANDIDSHRIWNRKVSYSTKNMAKGPAMTKSECMQAILNGIDVVREVSKMGYELLMTGEMGIGNTATSSAVLAVLANVSVEEVTGKGAGLSEEGIQKKIQTITTAIEWNQPNPADIIDILSKVGGFDICGMVGAYLGAAIYQVPIIMDGFIAAVAAACAMKLEPLCEDYIFASHTSAERAGKLALELCNKTAYLDCDMCLGEGTGAVLAAKLMDFALAAFLEDGSFEESQLEPYQLFSTHRQ